MPPPIPFTGNHEDLSTDRGYQFKFYCEKCGNGYMSSFQTSKMGMLGSAARVAGGLFGGVFGRVADSAYEVQRAVGGTAHDSALKDAVTEIAPTFKQCTRCGNWVCQPVCWNKKAGLCETCAPDMDEEMAAAQAEAAREQIHEKARTVDWTKQRDVKTVSGAVCGECGAKTQGGKFCHDCGAPLAVKTACAQCGHQAEGTPKILSGVRAEILTADRLQFATVVNHTIIVLFGGTSDERHVSVASAQNVLRALDGKGALAWFQAPDGAIHDVAPREVLAHEQPFVRDFIPSRPAIFPDVDQALDTVPVDAPLFFLALHGTGGEDGTLQRLLEARGLPFTGSGAEASAAAFDKDRAKEQVKNVVRVAESRVARDASAIREVIADMLSRHERIVLKPLAAGSSRGLFFLGRDGNAEETAAQITALGIPYIVEQFIRGRELTVGVLDQGDGPFALPVIEIEVDSDRAFDYEGKYLGHGTREICPAVIPETLAQEAQQAALAAHVALGCEGYSRSDFVAADDGVYYLETNTLPGLTTSSLVPQELTVVGISFREFLERQMQLAVAKAVP